MTDRLSKALQQLSPDQIERVTDFAEFLAGQQASQQPLRTHLTLDWAGAAVNLAREYSSGVEAAHAAADMIAKSALGKLER